MFIISLLILLVSANAQQTQQYELLAGAEWTITPTKPDNLTNPDLLISATSLVGTDFTIRCQPLTPEAQPNYPWVSALPSGSTERLYIAADDAAFDNEAGQEKGEVRCSLINTSQPPRPTTISVTTEWLENGMVPQITSEQEALSQLYSDCCGENGAFCPGWALTGEAAVDTDFCSKPGQVCNAEGQLLQLSLDGFNMSCAFPTAQLAALTQLRVLDMGLGNYFTGNWEEVMFPLSSLPLETLLLRNNPNMQGALSSSAAFGPVCALATSTLRVLDIFNSSVSGTIPECLLNGTSTLQYLRLGYNQLEGSIPDVFSDTSALAWFTVNSNQLTGTIPESFGRLPNLFMFNATSNNLEGPLPDNIGNPPMLMHIIARNNNITGSLPSSTAGNVNLITIDLRNNALTGLPTQWYEGADQLDGLRLQAVRLANNSLTGEIPVGLAKLSNLLELNLAVNNFNGSLPVNPTGNSFVNMLLFNMSGNQLSGSIPDVYGVMRMWSLQSNLINTANGMVPWQMIFDVSANQLSGPLPPFLSNTTLSGDTLSWTNVSVVSDNAYDNACEDAFAALNTCNQSTTLEGWTVSYNEDLSGDDVERLPVMSRNACAAACYSNPLCSFAVLRQDGTQWNGCWLKANPNFTTPEQPGFIVLRHPAPVLGAPAPEGALVIPETQRAAYDSEATVQQQQQTQNSTVAAQQGSSFSSNGLSAGAIIGIVIGALAGTILLALLAFVVVKKLSKKSPSTVTEGTVVFGKGARSFQKFTDQPEAVHVQAVTRSDV